MPTPLENLQAAYANICQQLADMTTDPKPSYSSNGRSVSWGEHFGALSARLDELRKIPGVAPDTVPTFDVISVAR